MIVRVWQARATAQNAGAYRRHLERNVLPELRTFPGFSGVRLLERHHKEDVALIVMTSWQSMDAVRAFAGSDPQRAVVEPEARAVLASFDDRVAHYDVTLEAGVQP